MLYQIADGTVSLGGREILSHINFEIKSTEKIALVGKNGAGKTTLLKLIAGELSLDRDDKRKSTGLGSSRRLTIGMLSQQAFADKSRTVEEELLAASPCQDTFDQERYRYELEYDRLFTGFGFSKRDKLKPIGEFSGGEQTKIGMIRLFLQKPDILLLDEPTNHLDFRTVEWLEDYLRQYERAVIMVSHDRFFLDQTAEVIYELEAGKLHRYPGNYTQFKQQKAKEHVRQQRAYERQQEEIKRLEDLIGRFKHKPNKAAFARAKKKQLERIARLEAPARGGAAMSIADLTPAELGSKVVFEAEHLRIGYQEALTELSLRIRRGQKVGVIGANGAGKSTFLKTIAGFTPPLNGHFHLGNQITIGYFDQHTAELDSEKSVLDYFHDGFPSLPEKELRSVLGAYLFGGAEAAKQVSGLSGGEKARLKLAEILTGRPNFLILDEPTNHMDIRAREVLEAAFQAYSGTMLFVSHDRYFLSQVAEAVLIFDEGEVMYYPFGYQHYAQRLKRGMNAPGPAAQIKAEEQALIDGLKAVPKAERHRLREISAEEVYLDWQLRMAGERMDELKRRAQECYSKLEAAWERQLEADNFISECSGVGAEYEEICTLLTDACLEWYDFYIQIPVQ